MKDAMEYMKRCDVRQRMQSVPWQPVTEMSPVVSAIPFFMWGIDLVGQFLKPPVKYKDVVVAVDYFSKWVEVATMENCGRFHRGIHMEKHHHPLWYP
ncbi:hypothetical protein LIER_16282 [Lithospermum erythrorhizon]|uniref:Reverse transcriptase domain-containing protein n=1 Tax=Lithospermum erythrorhizon TaxID=34254 RepID=A0AAV3QAP0_LITER